MKVIQIILMSSLVLSLSGEAPGKKPLGYGSRLHTNGKKPFPLINGRRAVVLQIRSDSPVPFVLKRPNRPLMSHKMRPIAVAISPHFTLKSTPLFGKYIRKPTAMMKLKLPNTKSKPDYFYEKPFSPAPEFQKLPVQNNIHFTTEHFGPIHTIPAPNLGIHAGHLSHDQPVASKLIAFNHHPQYQVTEESTNDQTLFDPLSGQHKYFAPDPDPSLPAPKLRVTADPFSTPSNSHSLPSDVQTNLLSSNGPVQQASLVQFVHTLPQQKYPDGYGIPIANQPQLRQYILQQANTAQRLPLAVYDPTYLVTQSNNLYNQHQEQLFKPNPSYLESLKPNYAGVDFSHEVASAGQIFEAAKDDNKHFQNTVDDIQSHNQPSFAALVGTPTNYDSRNNALDQHFQSTIRDYSLDNSAMQGGFVVSNFYGNIQNPAQYQQNIGHHPAQHENSLKLQQANLELQQALDQNAHQYSNHESKDTAKSAFEEHQRLVQQHLNSSPLRIFVPDDDNYPDNSLSLQKRSDGYSDESSAEKNFDSSENLSSTESEESDNEHN